MRHSGFITTAACHIQLLRFCFRFRCYPGTRFNAINWFLVNDLDGCFQAITLQANDRIGVLDVDAA